MEHTSGHMLIEKLRGVNRKGTCSIVPKWRLGKIKDLGTECQKPKAATENAEGRGRKHKEAVSLPTLGCELEGKFLGKWLEQSNVQHNVQQCTSQKITAITLKKGGKKVGVIRNLEQGEERKGSNLLDSSLIQESSQIRAVVKLSCH